VATFGQNASFKSKADMLLLDPFVNNNELNVTLMKTNSDVMMTLH